MKLDPHIEIDRLLRRHARQESPLAPLAFAARNETGRDGGEGVRGPEGFAHLDADELSAYAENALPPAARARYTEHLADCDSCRKLVTELVMSSGVATQLEQQAATQAATISAASARSWRDWLRLMFAPAKLRYAASALLALGIVAIAVMVFKSRRIGFETTDTGQSQVSQPQSAANNSNTAEPSANYNAPNPEGSPAPASASPPSGLLSKEATPTSPLQGQETESPAVTNEPQKSGGAQGPAGETPAPPATSNNNFELPKNSARDEDNVIAKTEQPALSSDDKRKAKKEIDGADSTEEQARLRPNRESASNTKSAAPSENKQQYGKVDESAGRRARGSGSPSPPKDASPSATAGVASGASIDDRAERADRPAKSDERRSVGGKQFVRRGGAWVDTAYSSQATTNVRRGSEQYRALAADEPGLRDIANQLGGEVVIVWKGRAYRIR
ncbi:MAG TPA: zf-HC2 domain-containing protein [Pyrinomonadaceae bacterium]|jgi:hypothetical protein